MRHAFIAAWMLLAVGTAAADDPAQRPLTFEDRVKAQRAIEEVYWRHRIWPKENAAPRPAFPDIMPESEIRARVEVYLRKTHRRSGDATRGITASDLQAELDRMARDSRDRRTLRELFDALGDDPFLIAETLARQTLSERLAAEDSSGDLATSADALSDSTAFPFRMPQLEVSACEPGTWAPTHMDVPDRRLGHYAVWTGSEMIVWGGNTYFAHDLQSGGRYDPLTDTWIPTSTGDGVPVSVYNATVVWTGSEMIVWGGLYFDPAAGETYPNTGSRYSPATDSWQPVSRGPNTPTGRHRHTAVWTGTEMVVWGGHYYDPYYGNVYLNTGARYDPATDTWQPVSNGPNTPSSRRSHTAVWTGSEMIVWGGDHVFSPLNTGGRYDPSNDTWRPTSTGANLPFVREDHTAVWTGDRMIVWGGTGYSGYPINTGGRYDPVTDTWQPTSTGTGVPPGSASHTGIWSGSKMIVWGGDVGGGTSAGAIYDPAANTWRATAVSPLSPRTYHTAVWTGTEMIVWGGWEESRDTNSGARYDPTSDTWITMSANVGAATGRQNATGVWTGAEMIVWGGLDSETLPTPETLNTGGRYLPATDSWIRMSTANAPASRYGHIGVWTGREMIVWGGNPVYSGATWLTSGGRYDPSNDTWTATADDANTPPAAAGRSAVWTGREMIVWGGSGISSGGRYDPASDSWTPTSTGANVPSGGSSTVWSGMQMIVWNGESTPGGRYDPRTDTWESMASGAGLLGVRSGYSAVWSGDEMIVWGGWGGGFLNTGARYDPSTDTWMAMSNLSAASPRASHQAVWTGASMILWGGNGPSSVPSNGGGVYEPATDSWSGIAAEPPAPTARAIAVSVWTGTSMIVWGGQTGTAAGGVYCACPEGRLMYRDTDGDGYGDPAYSAPSCDGSIAQGYVANQLDCDDSNSNVHPGAAEVCDGIDDNCDVQVDEGGNDLCDDHDSCTENTCHGGAGCLNRFLDDDEDGVCDAKDQCPATIVTPTVVIDSCDSGVRNYLFPVGCNFGDEIAECQANATGHDQFVSCVARAVDAWKNTGLITGQQGSRIVRCAAQ
jgi:N-acetylneuraminic acid mutarotase